MLQRAVAFLWGSPRHLSRVPLKRRDSSSGHWTNFVTTHRPIPVWGLAAGLAATALIAQPTLATAQDSNEAPVFRLCKWLESQGADLSGIQVEVGFTLPATGMGLGTTSHLLPCLNRALLGITDWLLVLNRHNHRNAHCNHDSWTQLQGAAQRSALPGFL